jgi:hypothetical protein
MIGSFTKKTPLVAYIPNLRAKRVNRGHRKTRHIHSGMDQPEARRQTKRCSARNKLGHTYKHCTKNADDISSTEVGPSREAIDGRPPSS